MREVHAGLRCGPWIKRAGAVDESAELAVPRGARQNRVGQRGASRGQSSGNFGDGSRRKRGKRFLVIRGKLTGRGRFCAEIHEFRRVEFTRLTCAIIEKRK